MAEQYWVKEVRSMQGQKGPYELVTLVSTTGEEISAGAFPPISSLAPVKSQWIYAEVTRKGNYRNIKSFYLSPPSSPSGLPSSPNPVPPAPPSGNSMEAPASSFPQPPSPPQPQPQQAQIQHSPQPSAKDLMMVKMSATRAAAEVVHGMIVAMSASGNPPSHDQIKEMVAAYSQELVAYILSAE